MSFLQNVSNLIGVETLNIMTLVKMTLSITLKRSVEFRNLVHYAYCRYAKQGTLT
jgi:aconitase B